MTNGSVIDLVVNYFRDLGRAIVRGWDRFWFTPTDPATYSLIRILAGWMLFYTHLVWGIGLEDFFGDHAWLTPDVTEVEASYNGSYFELIHSTGLLWGIHIFALVCMACLTVGLFSRPAAILSAFFTLQYANRIPGATFGLDQINALLAIYLVVGPSGARYSVDRLITRWRGKPQMDVLPSVGANVGIRLIQLHMCVIYLFAGIGKSGLTWWNGEAMWLSVASYEYQSMDMTWLANWPITLAVLTHVSVWWEMSYCVLVWPRITRPILIALAFPLHIGIAAFMGMITFGYIMIVGNLAFVSPWLVRRVLERKQPSEAEQTASVGNSRRNRRHQPSAVNG
ncbi:MAG: HTTM domain-containing protein [Pirellulales bacterium]|nr:HTTM domain-containing protein [Pirellulales bacterium]